VGDATAVQLGALPIKPKRKLRRHRLRLLGNGHEATSAVGQMERMRLTKR
jgi:hypothetical protein